MPKLAATAGQLLINDALPPELRDYSRVLDKKGVSRLLSEVAAKYPDKYREISFQLATLGKDAAYVSGGNSFNLLHLRTPEIVKKRRKEISAKLDAMLNDDTIDDKVREKRIVELMGGMMKNQQNEIFDEAWANKNPLAVQLVGAGRGNKMTLASLLGSDGLYMDHRENVIPVPILRSYSQGLSPAEYWAATYGARHGVMATKFAVADSGFLAKQLGQIVHRSLVTALDDENESPTLRGLPVDVDDEDNEGSLLATPVGGFERNTILTPKILRQIKDKGINRILVRSPAVTGTPDGGVYARDVGVREFGRLPMRGENVGLTAAQALSEPISQGQLSAKHAGGVAGGSKAVSGFDYINQLVQVPKTFRAGAAHATVDGTVQRVEPAPAGGHYVTIDGERHYVAEGYGLKVKRGDKVEAGDVLSDGTPNPAIITQYKGIGEGRRYFIQAFREAMRNSNMSAHRRNVELLARGMINHVRMTDEIGDYAPDDVVPYSSMEAGYEPREGARKAPPAQLVGRYLERPYLHYTIGTKIRPSMLKEFSEFGVGEVEAHDKPPPFEAEMIRGMSNLQHDPDWMTRMFGSGLKSSLLKGVHRGATADETGTSFVASRARAVDFGRTGKVMTPRPFEPQELQK